REVVVEDEDGPLLRRQAPEGALQHIAGRRLLLRVALPDAREAGQLHMDLRAVALPRAARLAVARANQQPMQPGVEPVRVADGPDVEPGRDQRLLDRIDREAAAAEDKASRSMQAVERVGGQRRERVVVTRLCPQDEVSPHGTPCRPGARPALTNDESNPAHGCYVSAGRVLVG